MLNFLFSSLFFLLSAFLFDHSLTYNFIDKTWLKLDYQDIQLAVDAFSLKGEGAQPYFLLTDLEELLDSYFLRNFSSRPGIEYNYTISVKDSFLFEGELYPSSLRLNFSAQYHLVDYLASRSFSIQKGDNYGNSGSA